MPSPYLCERFHPTRGSSRRKSLFLNFANAKAAAPGFEHSHFCRRALMSIATAADYLTNSNSLYYFSVRNHSTAKFERKYA